MGVESPWGPRAEDLPALILFSSEFGAPVSVPVQDILDLICRTLSVSAKNIVSGVCPLFTALAQDPGQPGKQCGLWLPKRRCLRSPRPAPSLSRCRYSRAPGTCTAVPIRSRVAGALAADASSGEGELGVSCVTAARFGHPSLVVLPGSVEEDGSWILLGELGSGVGSLPACTCVFSHMRVSCLHFSCSASLSSPTPCSANFFHRVCLEMVPCGCCCCPPSTWKPWTCSLRSSSREWGRVDAVQGLGCAGRGAHCSVFAPRCGGRLLRFGALISRLLPQVLNAWSIGRDSLSPGQERPYR